MEDTEQIGLILTTVAFVVGLVLLLWGITAFSTASYVDPLQGVHQSLAGALAAGIGAALVLTALGAVSVVATILAFILELVKRR